MSVKVHEENPAKVSASWRARATAQDESHWFALKILFFYMYLHRHLDFFCIFIFEREVLVVMVLGMIHVSVLLIPILIVSARFFADSFASASFLCDLI